MGALGHLGRCDARGTLQCGRWHSTHTIFTYVTQINPLHPTLIFLSLPPDVPSPAGCPSLIHFSPCPHFTSPLTDYHTTLTYLPPSYPPFFFPPIVTLLIFSLALTPPLHLDSSATFIFRVPRGSSSLPGGVPVFGRRGGDACLSSRLALVLDDLPYLATHRQPMPIVSTSTVWGIISPHVSTF